jgi:hypothetical protein
METLITRSFYSPAGKEAVPVIRNDDSQFLQLVDYLRTPYKVFTESYTPNSNTARRRVASDLDKYLEASKRAVDVDLSTIEGLKVWKPFQHYKAEWEFDSLPKPTVRLGCQIAPSTWGGSVYMPRAEEVRIAGVFGETGDPTKDLPVWFDPDADEGEWIIPPEELDALIQRSLKRLVPKVKNQVQLLNTLYELKDVRSIGHTISRVKALGRSLKIKGLLGSLREVAVSGADIFLQMRFNIEPLIRDIQGIYHALVDSLGPLRKQMQFDGTPQTSYFRCLFDEDESPIHDQLSGYFEGEFEPNLFYYQQAEVRLPSGKVYYVNREVETSRSHFYAQLRFVARWTANQHKYAEQLALIDALGLSFNPKHVWDAIPWSFVVDWVIKVGDFLDGFGKGALDPVLDILDYSWSVKRERTVQLTLVLNEGALPPGSLYSEANVVKYPLYRETAYRRQPLDVGSFKSALVLSGVSSSELSLAAALVVTRKRKLRKPKQRSGKRRQRIKPPRRKPRSSLNHVIS